MAASLAAMLAASSHAQAPSAAASAPGEPIVLKPSPVMQPPPRGDAANRLPIILQADRVSGSPGIEATAEGHALFRRSGTSISADKLRYENAEDLATATGNVRISRDGNVYTGPELQLKVERFQGYFLNPTYRFAKTGAGGKASRIDFIDQDHSVATDATYTSCTPDGAGTPAWLLSADKLEVDAATNTGVAKGGVLRFYGVPILAAPEMSFPLTDDRKSGWLPPTIGLDSNSGTSFAIPYYWNIAPNRDATITPGISTRRGPSVDTEIRYLEPSFSGLAELNLVPYDREYGSKRYSADIVHDSQFADGTLLHANLLRVSDDDYWKDFSTNFGSQTPRLLGSSLSLSRPLGDWTTYARIENWQVLQTTDPTQRILAPYEREPQVGARYLSTLGKGIQVGFETEYNHFISPENASLTPLPTGDRFHALGSVAYPYVTPGWVLTPKVSFNAATYNSVENPVGSLQPGQNGSRFIPTFSVDSAWVFERNTDLFGKAVRQTLEPRLFYVNTPYRDQSQLPNFDAYAKDLNFDSIFTENAFSGVDRVSDANQLTAGAITRFIDPDTGGEKARFGIAQRYLLRDQRVTPDNIPVTRRFSDLLLLGSTTVVPAWGFDAAIDYSPGTHGVARSLVGVRYSPSPYHTVSLTYRQTQGLTQQFELGWQWPIFGPARSEAQRGGGSSCTGTLYGVGRLNYSTFDRRLVDAIAGVEYDAGCWIGRIVATRQSTGLSESTTRLMFQLELVGLSRLGSNPLQLLKDNIPGYRLLRDDSATPASTRSYDD